MEKKVKKKKSEEVWERHQVEPYEEGTFKSEAAIVKTPTGREALQIGTSRKFTEKFTKRHKGLWIPKEVNIGKWFKWLTASILKLFKVEWGLDIENSNALGEKLSTLSKEIEQLEELKKQKSDELEKVEKRKEEYDFTLSLARETKETFDKYKETYEQLKKLILDSVNNNKGKEEDIKTLIKEHSWLLGLDCEVKAKNKDVDTQTQIDLHIENDLGQNKIYELKSPNIKLFFQPKGKNKKRLIISDELADALSEIIIYMRRTDIYSDSKSQGTYGIQKAIGIILADYNLNADESEILNELNFHLAPYIQIVTYDTLMKSIEKELEIIKQTKNDNPKSGKK